MIQSVEDGGKTFADSSRRQGDRRKRALAVDHEKRNHDRRQNRPGLSGLIRDVFGFR
jgi:hypothetical protein